jgi:hypothetical protein
MNWVVFFNLEFMLGLALGICMVVSAWASKEAFGHWYTGGLLILGIDTIKKEKPE